MLPEDLLAKNPLFDTMQPEDIQALAKHFIERSYAKGAIVFDKEDSGSSMYIIRSGGVQIFLPPEDDTPRVVLADLHAGEYFGELSLFDDKPRSASVEATVDTTLLELTRDDFAEHLSHSKTATLAILAELAERLRETNAMVSQRAAKDAVKEFEEHLTWGQRLADRVAELNGSWSFILFLVVLTIAWVAVNTVLPNPFDGYPYQFYNLALAIVVGLQGPLIVMSQNRQSSKDRLRAQADFNVNLKNEVGIETLVRELATFRAEANVRLRALERRDGAGTDATPRSDASA